MREITYEVTVKRHKRDVWFEAPYSVRLDIYEGNERVSYDDRYYDWTMSYTRAFTINRAKKKALRRILKHQKAIKAGKVFGVVFTTKGTAEELETALRK